MISILPAGLNEINIIHNLAHQIWRTSYKEILSAKQMEYMLEMMYSHNSLQYQIEKQQHAFIIAYEDEEPACRTGRPVGFAAFFQKYNISPALYRLDKIYVLPEMHGKGVGKKIIDHIVSIIKPLGASVLELNVNRNNKAVSFYHKLGFIITKEVDVPIGEGYFMNDYVMQKSLS